MESVRTWFENRLLKKNVLSIGYYEGVWTAIKVRREKDDLEIVDDYDGLDTILVALIDNKNLPIILNIKDKSVLFTIAEEDLSEKEVLARFEEEVPGSKVSDFLLDYSGSVIAFTRNKSVEQVVSNLEKFKEQIVAITLAPSSGLLLANINNKEENDRIPVSKGNRIMLGGFEYVFDEDKLIDIDEGLYHPISLEGINLKSDQVNAFASVLGFVSQRGMQFGLDWLSESKDELIFKKLLVKIQYPLLGFLLIIFLINGLLFTRFNNENQQLLEKSGTLQLLDQKLNSLNKYVEENGYALDLLNTNKPFSALADQVGASVPKQVKLTKLTLRPIESERSKSGQFIKDKLVIEGLSKSPQIFSDWIGDLEDEVWVNVIQNQQYENINNSDWSGKFKVTMKTNAQ